MTNNLSSGARSTGSEGSHTHTKPLISKGELSGRGQAPRKPIPDKSNRHRGTLRWAFAGATPKSQTRESSSRRKGQRVGEGAWRLHQLLSQSAHSAWQGEAPPGPQPKACGGPQGAVGVHGGDPGSPISALDSGLPRKFFPRYKAQVRASLSPQAEPKLGGG